MNACNSARFSAQLHSNGDETPSFFLFYPRLSLYEVWITIILLDDSVNFKQIFIEMFHNPVLLGYNPINR